MSYHYDRKKKYYKRLYGVFIVLIGISFLTPVYSFIFDVIEQPLKKYWENQSRILTDSDTFFQSLYGKQQIIKENTDLKNRIKELEIDNLRTQYLSEELEKIYSLDKNNEGLVYAHVLSHGVSGFKNTFVINKGTQDGIKYGDTIIAYTNVLVGFVDEVYDITSRVTLYADPHILTQSILFPEDISITIKGYGNDSFIFEVSRHISVSEGDIIYSFANKGTLIALVRYVDFDPRDSFKTVYASYPINSRNIKVVGIKKRDI